MQWRSNKNHVRRRKFKKFNYLKHNPQKRPIAIAEDNIEQRKSYASAGTGNFIKALLWKQSKTNLQPTLIVKEKFQVLHITKNQQKIQGKLPSRNNLATGKRKQHSKNKELQKLGTILEEFAWQIFNSFFMKKCLVTKSGVWTLKK